MNQSDVRTQNQSPHKFARLNQSSQFIADEFTLQGGQQQMQSPKKEVHKLGIKKTLFLKDNTRKKLVGCHIHVYEMDAAQLARSKRGSIFTLLLGFCRICMNDEETSRFVHPCQCKGSSKYVHEECLKFWILSKNPIEKVIQKDIRCEICSENFRMKMQIEEVILNSRFSEIPNHRKVCWSIELFIILLLIAGAIILGLEFGFSSVVIDAVITLLVSVALVLIFYLIAGIVQSLTVEMIVAWSLSNYHSNGEDYQIGTVLNIQAPNQLKISQDIRPSPSISPRSSPKAKRKSITPYMGGIQVIQFSQYPEVI